MSGRSETSDHDAGDRDFERVARLVRAASTSPVDTATARATRTRFLDQIAADGQPGRARRFVFAALAVGAMGAAAAVLFTNWPRSAPAPVASAPATPDAPALAAGTLVRFRDGSEIEVALDGRARLAESSGDGGRVLLEDGGLRVRVTPRPAGAAVPARWTFQAGPFRVQVKGTAFRIRWHSQPGVFELEMTEGEVLATGPGLARKVVAGERLRASGDGKTVELAALAPVAPIAQPREAAAPATRVERANRPSPARRLAVNAPAAATWSHLVASGKLDLVLAQAEAEGIAGVLERRREDDLAALGTAARLGRRFDPARQVFRAQRLRFARSDTGREAAFHLGRLADDVDGDTAGAVAWYDQYLADAPGGALAAEALGRKLAALDRQPGARAACRDAARTYLARFPDGPHRDLARRLVAPGE